MSDPEPITLLWLALRSRIETIPLSPALPIAWPAADFEPGADPYLSVAETSFTQSRLTIGAEGPYRGSGYQPIDLVVPVALKWDTAAILNKVGQITGHFPVGLVMRCGKSCAVVKDKPRKVNDGRDGAYFRTSIIIPLEISI